MKCESNVERDRPVENEVLPSRDVESHVFLHTELSCNIVDAWSDNGTEKKSTALTRISDNSDLKDVKRRFRLIFNCQEFISSVAVKHFTQAV